MISYQKAIESILEVGRKNILKPETVLCASARNRVVFEPIQASFDMPSFDNSAMDGFAVVAAKTVHASVENPVSFSMVGEIPAGLHDELVPNIEGTIRVFTGSFVPEFYDAVVKQEEVRVLDSTMELTQPVKAGQNIRFRGEDFKVDGALVGAGTILCPKVLSILASQGIGKALVYKKPRVALLSTGNELRECDDGKGGLLCGQIYNSSRIYLKTELESSCDVTDFGLASDNPKMLYDKLCEIIDHKFDVVLTTGGVSVGRYDLVPSVLNDLHVETIFHGVAIRPGKPIFLGTREKTTFFGLPGNAISTMVGFDFFVSPYLRSIHGRGPRVVMRTRLKNATPKPLGLRCFFKANIDFNQNEVTVLEGQSSHKLSPLLISNGWVVLEEEGRVVSSGTKVCVYPFYET